MEEIYKDIPGYEGSYMVSNFGNVKSLNRPVIGKSGHLNKRKGIILNCYKSNGYLRIRLHKDGMCKMSYVHQLVAMAFLGHIPNGYKLVIDHIDSNKLNNNKDNLQIVDIWTNNIKTIGRNNNQKYNGIVYHSRDKKYQLCVKKVYYGTFNTEEEAYKQKLNLNL